MASEIGALLVRSYSVDDAKCLKDAFDSFMKENTNFNEEVEDSQIMTALMNLKLTHLTFLMIQWKRQYLKRIY